MADTPERLTKPYRPEETEKRIYETWEKSGFFNPDNLPESHKDPYTIIMPPPNANGRLHAGHALFITLEDIVIRYKRMRGYKALWVPGADHAGFETQIVYEKKLEKEGRSRFGMDPADLYKEIYAFTLENKKHMEDDIRSLGASCDWSREKFTLEPAVVKKVQQTFQKMYDEGLVYRGKRIVNWCARHQTTLSDVETVSEEKKDPFYYFQYGPFVIGTARPETKFGDKYVVMHPDDKRYAQYKHGDKLTVEWINGPMEATIIKDAAIDMEFGTGVMTITPWHSQIDFEIAERHKLDREQIIDLKGKLLPIAGEFAGQHISKARPAIVEKLKSKGLLVRVDDAYVHNVPCCYKCNTVIEPQVMDQWFIKMETLAAQALKAVQDKKIAFIPDNYEKIFTYWMSNTIDWNISRQIVWGIPIPAKICDACGHAFADTDDKITACPKCSGTVHADTDTFDTWFSSGQWPLLTLDFPDGKDFKTFYPTDVMETGDDLIFKWVPRMVIFGLYLASEVPFKTVYLHGLVNDAHGKKMSKSKGNVVSPLELTEKYGTDALRMALVVGNAPGTSTALAENKVKGYKHFANKIWNIARFVVSNQTGNDAQYSAADQALIDEAASAIENITKDIDNFSFHTASEKIYHYIWSRLADEIVEESKPILYGTDGMVKDARAKALMTILRLSLTTLHPFMPFVTEEIWSLLPPATPGEKSSLLMIEKWPV